MDFRHEIEMITRELKCLAHQEDNVRCYCMPMTSADKALSQIAERRKILRKKLDIAQEALEIESSLPHLQKAQN